MEEAIVSYLHGVDYPFDFEGVRQSKISDFSVEAVAGRVAAAAQGETCEPLDYLQKSGKRGSDYNANRWEKEGICHLPKRQWRGLSLTARIRLIRLLRAANLSPELSKQMKSRIMLNWI